ncbi:hypothetical protein V5799_017725 [Amblyomma americanum]|uniref:FP protein C-terminal domain-containing protein n=1 Tax=Amblyomma americanum TaxID=6943 RepID=A0AAQ4F1A8_AMBAM
MGTEIADLKREFRKELREIKQSLEFVNEQYEDMKKECASVKEENAALKVSNDLLAQEVDRMKAQVRDNSLRITAQDQYSRNKNVQVKGIPVEKGENLLNVLGKVGVALREPIGEQDIEVSHRVPVRNSGTDGTDGSDQNIVVVFNRQSKRDAVLEKARKTRFTTTELGFAAEQPVFVNEHLAPQLKKLLGMTVAKKKEMKWRYAWVRGGKIFARKTENSRVLRVTCEADLEKMM